MISVSWIARRAHPPVHGTVALTSIKRRRAQARGLTSTVNVLWQHLNTLGLGGWSFLPHWNGIQLYLCIGTRHTPKKLFWLSNMFKWPEISLCMKTQNNRNRRRKKKNQRATSDKHETELKTWWNFAKLESPSQYLHAFIQVKRDTRSRSPSLRSEMFFTKEGREPLRELMSRGARAEHVPRTKHILGSSSERARNAGLQGRE